MGSSQSQLKERHVVIVGGGYAGVSAANHLRGKCKLTLIDLKECMHHCIASLRAVVEPGYAKKIFIPYVPAFGDSFKQGRVTNIDVTAKKVTLDSNEEIEYDYLIIATGSTGPFPGKLDIAITDVPRAVDLYNDMLAKVKSAKDIVIIGGGAVGVELAGEICTDLDHKVVTLIHAKSALISEPFSNKLRKNCHDRLVTLGVEVLLDQKVTNLDDLVRDGSQRCTVKTNKDVAVEADLVFVCIGMKTNSEAYSNTLGAYMDERGCLKVDQFLQVEGVNDVFAIGDCCNADEEAKMAYKSGVHAEVVARNIENISNGKSLQPYKPPGTVILVPVGRHGGVLQYGSLVMGDFFARTLKSKDLFVPSYWGEMRQKVPLN